MSEIEKAIGLVPEIYFDFIGRIVPGALGTLALAVHPDVVPKVTTISALLGSTGLVFVGFLFSYLIGLILDVVGDAFSEAVFWVANRVSPLELRTIDQLFDQVGRARPDFAPVLLKIVAEVVALRSLLLLALLAMIHPFGYLGGIPLWMNLSFVLVLFAALLRMHVHARKRVPQPRDA